MAFAFAWPMQGRSLGELSNYALVRALASGTPSIDRTRFEVGDLPAGDFRTFEGRLYSDKAPGLAAATVPWYVTLRAAGMRTRGDPTEALWALRLIPVVLSALILLLLVRSLAERVAPGYGTATSVALGAGTLILPLATSFYSHVLSAFLLFACFALLWVERERRAKPLVVAAAGVLAGFAATAEYQTGLAGAAFGLYAIARPPHLARAAAYGAGVLAGVAPLLVYNQWAFGSVAHLSYFGDELGGGTFASWLEPSLLNGLYTYLSMPGLLVLAPILACGLVGLPLLYAQGKRAEALTIGLVALLFTVYNTTLPGVEYDAYLAGPRYLVPILPLLVLPAALTFRRWPLTTSALGLVSVIVLVTMTASAVPPGTEPRWFHALAERNLPSTAASLAGVTGWYAILAYFAALLVAVGIAALVAPRRRAEPADAAFAGLAVLAWAVAAIFAPSTIDGNAQSYGAYVPGVLAVLGLATCYLAARAATSSRQPKLGASVSPSST